MKYLLDVNVLLAAIWENHSRHASVARWIKQKQLFVCPLTQLGFLRLSSNPNIMNAKMEEARLLLNLFMRDLEVEWVPDDLHPLDSHPTYSSHVTDHYLADLAAKHALKLATLDQRISHPNIEIISPI